MRVCMLLDRERWHGDGRVRRELRALSTAGHDVVLLHRGLADADPALAHDGPRTLTVLPRRGRTWFVRIPWPLRRMLLAACFAWRAARGRPDVVHAHDLPMLAPAWVAARLARAALVFDSHEYQLGLVYHGPLARRVVRVLQRLLIGRCDAVVVVSEDTAARLREHYGVAAVVVRNLPEVDWPDRGEPGRSPVIDFRVALGIGDEPLLLAQGAVGRARGGEQVIDALARLEHGHAVFLGDAEPGWAQVLNARAVAMGVASRVHFVGGVALELLLDHTRQADLGLVMIDPRWANHRLTLPNKLFEYVVAGVPVIASEGTASARLVTELGVGWGAPFGDAGALAAALSAALARRGEADLRERLAAAGAMLTWERERERLLELYRSLAAARSDATTPADGRSSGVASPSSDA